MDGDVVRGEPTGSDAVAGRLGVLTGLSLAAGVIPLPFLPERLLEQLRGTVAHEVASRYGVSLSSDARATFAARRTDGHTHSVARKGLEMLVRRVLRSMGPFGPLSSAARAFEVYALGHLLERYFHELRGSSTLRVSAEEAAALRLAIDESVVGAFRPSTSPRSLQRTEGVEDLRDEFTRWIDTLLLTTATVPNYIARRLDAAFDEAVRRQRGLPLR